MSGHTPGPWVIVQGDEWTTDIATVEGDLPDGSPSHWTVASVNRRRDEWEQNRRLIAAAPELLEALIWMVENDDTYEGDTPLPDHSGATWNEINAFWIAGLNKARAAIAKASGEQP